MSSIVLGTSDIVSFDMNLYIQLHPEDSNFAKPYKNIVLRYGEEQLVIPTKVLFEKLKKLFNDDLDKEEQHE